MSENRKSYITTGIDLGTTNSAICVSNGDNYEIVKNSYQFDYTPSVFGIDKSGNYLVGKRAYDKLSSSSSADELENYKAEVKRLMGTSKKIRLPRADKEFLPEEISAEILKSLRADALKKFPNLQANSAVITVPAYFETLQCEATKRAGKLAGFEYVVLLQEPIAAALTYGFSNDEDANWLVYDLGGGTFDIALIQSKDNTLSVRKHNGDNFLGGKDFDARIVDKIFIPKLKEKFALDDLTIDNSEYSYLLTKLKFIAEESKIFLSKENSINIELAELGEDDDGQEIYLTFELSVAEFEAVVSDLVEKTIKLVSDTIKDSRVEKSKISTIVLVGGPTQLPFIRKKLEEATGIKVDSSVDPLTVVAKGAAIYGKSQKLPKEILEKGRVEVQNEIKLDLQYDSITSDEETLITGKFDVADGDYYVQIQSHDNQYVGDKVPLKQGKFFVTIPLTKDKTTTFHIYLIDKNQNPVPTFPDQFEITQGMSISGAPIPRDIGVVYSKLQISGGLDYKEICDVYFKAGNTLPLKHTENFKTLREVKKGEANDLLIKVYEGDNSNIELNRILTTLSIDGSKIPYNLPEGSDIEITIKMDESREFEVEAYIPEFDISIDARVAMYGEEITNSDIKNKIDKSKQTFEKNKDVLPKGQRDSIEAKIEEIEKTTSTGTDDEDKKNLVIKECNEILEELEKVDEKSSASRIVDDVRKMIAAIRDILNKPDIENHDKIEEQIDGIEKEVNDYEKKNNLTGLQSCSDKLLELITPLLAQTIDFWIIQLQNLEGRANMASDTIKFNDLKRQGINAANNNDIDSLKGVCLEMWELLPHQEGETFGGNLSGVTK